MRKGLMVFPQDLEIDTDSERFAHLFDVTFRPSSCGRFAQLLRASGNHVR